MLRWCQSTLRKLDGHGCKGMLYHGHHNKFSARHSILRPNGTREPMPEYTSILTHVAALSFSTCTSKQKARSNIKCQSQDSLAEGASPDSALLKLGDQMPCRSPQSDPWNKLGEPGLTHDAFMAPRDQAVHDLFLLRNLLSSIPVDLCQWNISIDDVISLYNRAKTYSHFQGLSGEEISELLAFFGTLSLSSPHPPCIYDSQLVPHFAKPSFQKDFWSVVLEIAQEKVHTGHFLHPRDHYWVMRAYLSRLENPDSCPDGWQDDLFQAFTQYQHLKHSTDDQVVHFSYFKILTAKHDIPYIARIIEDICHFLSRVDNPQVHLVKLLWSFIIEKKGNIPEDLKDHICRLILHRLERQHPTTGESGSARLLQSEPFAPQRSRFDIVELASSFSSAIFPCYKPSHPSLPFHYWATSRGVQAFNANLPIEVRWNHVLLLVNHLHPGKITPQARSPASHPQSGSISWHAVFVLATLSRALMNVSVKIAEPHASMVRRITNSLWELWRTVDEDHHESSISHCIIATLFRICATTSNGDLFKQCVEFSKKHHLWILREDADHVLTIDTIAAYLEASIMFESANWAKVYSTIPTNVGDMPWRTPVTDKLLRTFTSRIPEIAYQLYLYGRRSGIELSSRTLFHLATSLASAEQWKFLTAFLRDQNLSRSELQAIVGTCLSTFQVQKLERVDPSFVSALSMVAVSLYGHAAPPPSLKYPIRYFFTVMVNSGSSRAAITLIQAIHRSTPDFFTLRVVRRLVLQLVRHRHMNLAVHLYEIFGSSSGSCSRSLADIRRKLSLRLFNMGNQKLTHCVRSKTTRRTWMTRREWLTSSNFDGTPRHRLVTSRVKTADAPTIRQAISLLVKSKRLYAARKLLAQTIDRLDMKTGTAAGNIVLHGSIYQYHLKKRHRLRHVLNMKDYLVKQCGFSPDRASINILVKAMFQWKCMFTASRLRQLFDQMIHDGYPAPVRFRRLHGVPFNHARSASSGFAFQGLSTHISFGKHTRPLYKMFIKAFYLRSDIVAAKTVIGILKEVEIEDRMEREKRNRARREGIAKKKFRQELLRANKPR